MNPIVLLLIGLGPFTAAPVSDAELGQMRGGFRLPNGIDIALTVQTQTAVDGAIVLRTVFRAADSAPSLVAYVPKAGTTVAAPTIAPSTATMSRDPVVTYDSRTGIRVTPPGASLATVGNWSSALDDPDDAFQQAGADSGVVQSAHGGVRTAAIEGVDLTITHFAGQAFGSAIANSGSDRTIDTVTSVSIALDHAGPDVLGSSGFRVQNVALDALMSRVR